MLVQAGLSACMICEQVDAPGDPYPVKSDSAAAVDDAHQNYLQSDSILIVRRVRIFRVDHPKSRRNGLKRPAVVGARIEAIAHQQDQV